MTLRLPALLITPLFIGLAFALPGARAAAQDAAFAYALATGQGTPWAGPSSRGQVALLVRFDSAAVPVDDLYQLANRGVSVATAGGRPLVWHGWALVYADARGAEALRTLQSVRQIRVAPPAGRPPLDRSAERLGTTGAWGARANERWTGEGVLIADADSHVDVFHPDFFHADAGWYDWIDTDGDGVLTPGVDAVDLDGDGMADDGEVARVLRASPIDLYGADTGPLTRPRFDPSVDWIYADVDGDRERGFGAPEFSDADPAFGEPLFVPDDVNGNGRLDPEERLVRLGTSKLRAVLVRVDYPGLPRHSHVYERGVDLAESPSDLTGGVYGYADTLHASGVIGILAGGVALPSRRWVGIAPDAELVNAFDLSSTSAGNILWALSYEPDVLIHEYVTWADLPLDGSDAYGEIIDEATLSGVANVCPAGNIGDADRHAERSLASGAEQTLVLQIPPGLGAVQLALHARGAGTLSAALIDSAGTAHTLGTSYSETSIAGGATLYAYGQTSPRETQMRFATLYPPPEGALSIRVRAEGGPLVVHAMSADDYGFARGAAWEGATAASTVAAPATADSCLAVGSVPSHVASEGRWYARYSEGPGEVRGYSARGPRIDGELRPHVVAPDNPWAPLGAGEILPSSPGAYVAPHGAYMVFGGTSGAGPHVAGVAALLAQSGLEGAAILERIRETAVVDPIAGEVPNDDYGYGRLSAAAALGGEVSAPPVVTLRAEPPVAEPGQPVRLIADATDPDGGPVSIRWDDGYDGSWDTSYGPAEERTVALSEEGVLRFRVRARDETGAIADAALKLIVTNDPPPLLDGGVQQPDGGTDGAPAGGCGCRVGGRPSALGLAPLAAILLVWRIRRRRRRA